MPKTELFGTETCEFTRELRDWLEWNGRDFVEHDVEHDPEALRRMRAATGGQSTVPVLMEDGAVVQIGWRGRGCTVAVAHASACRVDNRVDAKRRNHASPEVETCAPLTTPGTRWR